MDAPDLYEGDILAWSEQQAAALRRLAARRDLPNELDLDNVIEEIESVGRGELHAVESCIQRILEHAAKAASQPDVPSIGHWRTECTAWQARLVRRFSPAMRSRMDMGELWRLARRQAAVALEEHGAALAPELAAAAACPVGLDDLLAPELEFRAVVARIARELAS